MSLRVSPTYPAVAVHVAAQESPTFNSRKRPLEQEEEVLKPIFDVEVLSVVIKEQLHDCGDSPPFAAEALSTMNPDLLMQFSIYRPSQILKIFADALKTAEYSEKDQLLICDTVRQLCITSLINSKYEKTLATLEKKILGDLQLATPLYLDKLISRTQTLINSRSASCTDLNLLGDELDQVLDLFYYASPDAYECINVLARNVFVRDDIPRYPECKKHFRGFCQNLNLLGNQQAQLQSLRVHIRDKLRDLQQAETKRFCETHEKKEAALEAVLMDPNRAKFCNAENALLWQTGSKLLKDLFVATLAQKKKNKKWKMPTLLEHAINETAKMNPTWTRLQSNQLLPKSGSIPPFPNFEEGFVANVWGCYTQEISHIEDIGALIRYFISALPKQSFDTLLKAKDKSAALEKEFYSFKGFGGKDATFSTLKEWAEKQKRLIDEA